ncbi:MAG: hypothetical protein M3Q39_07890 [Actinomycetota bacterium]|nr:hypothetical protein [Actinomycetota bacterium]
MTHPTFTAADRLAAQAKRHSVRGKHEEAARLQREAVDRCRTIYEASDDPADTDDRERHEVAHRLADHYGRLGGIYRRAGQLESALDSYTRGAELERDWLLDDSYNRTNRITLSILVDPGRVPALAGEIAETTELVRSQVDRTRRDQWWAWADLGTLSLLDGRLRDALWAYDHFSGSGARRGDYESTLSVLRELTTAVSGVRPEHAWAFAAAIEHLEAARP